MMVSTFEDHLVYICLFLNLCSLITLKYVNRHCNRIIKSSNIIAKHTFNGIINIKYALLIIENIICNDICINKDYNLRLNKRYIVVNASLKENPVYLFEIFTANALRKLNIFNKTSFVDALVRLFSINSLNKYQRSLMHDSDILIDLKLNRNLCRYRNLNCFEKQLFDIKNYSNRFNEGDYSIYDYCEFLYHLNAETGYFEWADCVFYKGINGIFFSGGTILKCVSKTFRSNFEMNKMDLDIFVISDFITFGWIVEIICINLIIANYSVCAQKRGFIIDVYIDYNYTQIYNIPFVQYFDDSGFEALDKLFDLSVKWLKLQFIMQPDKTEYSILNAFDFDCVQLSFNGKALKATPACIQSLNTGTFINYTMNTNNFFKTKLNRICKYINRGWTLLAPQKYWNYLANLQSDGTSLALSMRMNKNMLLSKSKSARVYGIYCYLFYADLVYIKNKNFDFFGIRQKFLNNIWNCLSDC